MERVKNMTDEALIELFVNGNTKAFETLIERHREGLLAYIHCILHNQQAAEDILQDTFIKAFLTMRNGHFSDGGKFHCWLRRIAHNLIIDNIRHLKSDRMISCDTGYDILNNIRLAEGNIERIIEDKQTRDDIRTLINHLPAEQKEVVEMHYYKELTFKEIAEKTGVSINTSLGRMRYALINMRRLAAMRGIVLV